MWAELLNEGRRAGEFQVERTQSGPRREGRWAHLDKGSEGVWKE